MKQYLKALREYEINNNRFGDLCNYLSVRNSPLIKQYRDGAVNLPSFIMIKKLHNKYSELCSQDEELNNLFLNAIECSKLFYIRTLTLVKGSRTNGEEFEFSFEQTAQPLGRRLINLMINIKLRIRIARFKRKAKSNNEISKIFRVLYRVTEQINCFINNIIYKASLTQSTHHKLTKQLYYVTIAISILSLILTNSVFHQDLSRPAIITANTL